MSAMHTRSIILMCGNHAKKAYTKGRPNHFFHIAMLYGLVAMFAFVITIGETPMNTIGPRRRIHSNNRNTG